MLRQDPLFSYPTTLVLCYPMFGCPHVHAPGHEKPSSITYGHIHFVSSCKILLFHFPEPPLSDHLEFQQPKQEPASKPAPPPHQEGSFVFQGKFPHWIWESEILQIKPDFIAFLERSELLRNLFHHCLSCKFICRLSFILSTEQNS
jgi:hypothetical protein